jgi:hypothetical protein
LLIILYQVFIKKEKTLVWTVFPAQEVFVAAALQLCGIDARIFHWELKNHERDQLIRDLTTRDKSHRHGDILAGLNAYGMNLHPNYVW